MTITQTVTVPESRRLIIDVPPEVPTGTVVLAFTPDLEQRPIDQRAPDQRPDSAPVMSAEQELELINRNADRLNAEALDVLSYQDIDL